MVFILKYIFATLTLLRSSLSIVLSKIHIRKSATKATCWKCEDMSEKLTVREVFGSYQRKHFDDSETVLDSTKQICNECLMSKLRPGWLRHSVLTISVIQ